jgi:hypothetical protein
MRIVHSQQPPEATVQIRQVQISSLTGASEDVKYPTIEKISFLPQHASLTPCLTRKSLYPLTLRLTLPELEASQATCLQPQSRS